ncbi:hypothetical protein DFJ73DRAFT_357686 [Zopfochytrium polystomum]|nr:hypothetical protein DFJ73DRAFT_357686 [Zopfochytrium polystomum]
MKSNNNNMATPTAAATPPPPSSSSTTTSTPSTPTAEDQQLLMERYHRRLAIEYMMLQACCDGHTATVLELLASSDAADAIRVTNHAGQTPLHIAAAYGHMALVEMLVYRGHAVLDAVDAYDKTPMQLAAAHGHREVADFIAQQLERQRLHQLQQSPTTLAAASPTAASPAAASPAAAPPPPSDARQRLEQWLGPPVEFADDLERHGDAFAPGARSFYTEAVLAWLKMTNVTSNVLWLNAGSGFGKSAIAWHLSQTLPLAAPRWESAAGGDSWSLGATFFCSRSDTVRRDPFAFVATVVLDLCSAFPSFERHCLSVMAQDQLFQRIRSSNSDDSSTPTTTSSSTSSLLDDPEAAFQRLVVDGLRQVGPEERVPVVLIIDALDELGPPTGAYRNEAIPPDAADPELESKRVFLGLLSRLLPQLPAPWVRVFVTGRPERDVHYAMEKASAMRLPHVESTDAGDIDALSTAIVGRSSVLQWPSPPSADTVQTVARKALLYQSCSPLYTRLAWMHLEHFDGVQKREQVVQSLGAGVDGLYRQMLAHRFDSDSQYNNFRLVLMLIVAVREPMTQDELAHLLGTPSFVVGQILAQLGGLVNRVDQGRIKLIHYTLADHLTSPERCQNRQFFISRSEGSHRVLSACIKAMMSRAGDLSISEKAALLSRSGQRRWSVSRLVEDGANAADTTDPESRVLSYGARYWLWHLRDAIVDGSLRLILGLDDAEPTTFTLPPGKPLDDPHSLASQWVLFCARDAFGPAALLLGWETRSPTLIAAVLDGVRAAAIAGRVADAGEAIRGLFVDVAAVASPCFSPMRSLPAAAAPSSDAACKRSGAKARKVVNDDPEALYEFSERVGASGVGKVEVFKARAKKTGRPVSIKIVELDEDEDQTLLIDEVTRLRGMSNVNILSYNCHSAKTLMGTGSVWIVTESCGGSSLESAILDSQNLLQEHEIAAVLREVIKGLCFLHRLKRNHGNIKPGNIFLTDSGEVKLADLWLPISMLSPLRCLLPLNSYFLFFFSTTRLLNWSNGKN